MSGGHLILAHGGGYGQQTILSLPEHSVINGEDVFTPDARFLGNGGGEIFEEGGGGIVSLCSFDGEVGTRKFFFLLTLFQNP